MTAMLVSLYSGAVGILCVDVVDTSSVGPVVVVELPEVEKPSH